jgi:hypothetical protein
MSRPDFDPLAALGLTGPRPSWQEPSLTAIGREIMHAPLVPYSDRDAALEGGDSPWRLSLDGTWRFRLLDSPHAVTAAAVARDGDDAGWDAIEVPVSWGSRATARPRTPMWMPFAIEPPACPRRIRLGSSGAASRRRRPGRSPRHLTVGSAESARPRERRAGGMGGQPPAE